jgi:hypothetical protein
MPALLAELGRDYAIDVVDATGAHDFTWRQARRPFDLCVYELGGDAAHDFVWPYLFHYPGVLCLRTAWVHGSRTTLLARTGRAREHADEVAFGRGDLLHAPIRAARLVVVADRRLAARLREEHPDAVIRQVHPGWPAPSPWRKTERAGARVRFGAADADTAAVLSRAAGRAAASGASVEVVNGTDPAAILDAADVLVALDWPPSGEPPAAALAAMAHGKPSIVLETEATALWPALNAQDWRPRHFDAGEPPIVVSLDPRDEEHSLMLAVRRLAADPGLRQQLADAGRAWWSHHATIEKAVHAWRGVLEEAARMGTPVRPPGWPPHLQADGTDHARTVLRDFGLTVDVLEYPRG